MRDLEDEARIKAYMESKMKHIKMYNECMNLADGLDVEKFAELVRADEREACAKEADCEAAKWLHTPTIKNPCESIATAIRARGTPCVWEYDFVSGGFRMACTGGGINCSDQAELYNILRCPICRKRVEHRGER